MSRSKKNILGLTLLLVAAVIIGLTGFASRSYSQGFARVNTAQFKQMMNHKNFTLINVHTPYQGEIPGTDEVIPYDRIADFASRLPKDKNAPIVVYCMGASMGRSAAQTLVKMGYTHVTHYYEGMMGWREGGGSLIFKPHGHGH